MVNLKVRFRKKIIDIDVKHTGFIRRGTGLTFRTRNTSNLLFEFGKEVSWQGNLTSYFVFFPFLTLWLDKKNNVIDYRVIKPFIMTIRQKKKFFRIVEMPINKKNEALLVRFIGKDELRRQFAK